jgi:hypothetical protein
MCEAFVENVLFEASLIRNRNDFQLIMKPCLLLYLKRQTKVCV